MSFVHAPVPGERRVRVRNGQVRSDEIQRKRQDVRLPVLPSRRPLSEHLRVGLVSAQLKLLNQNNLRLSNYIVQYVDNGTISRQRQVGRFYFPNKKPIDPLKRLVVSAGKPQPRVAPRTVARRFTGAGTAARNPLRFQPQCPSLPRLGATGSVSRLVLQPRNSDAMAELRRISGIIGRLGRLGQRATRGPARKLHELCAGRRSDCMVIQTLHGAADKANGQLSTGVMTYLAASSTRYWPWARSWTCLCQ